MTTLLERARNGLPLGIDIIDIHGHLGRSLFTIPDVSPESLIRSMDRLGVRRIVCSHMRAWSHDAEHGNAQMLKFMRTFPGRILGYVSVYPAAAQTVWERVERWLAAGFIGLKLHNSNGFPYDDAAYEPAWAMADERRLPVLLHTWGAEGEFGQIRSLAGRYGGAALLLAHAGVHGEAEYVRIAEECPNVHLELASSQTPRGLVERLVAAGLTERIVWGSDASFLNQAQQLGKVVGADIPEEAKVQILSENPRRLLDRASKAGEKP